MNNQATVIIDYIINFFTRIDLLIFSHTNKRFNKSSSTKQKQIKFLKKHYNRNTLLCLNAAFEGHLNILIYLKN